MVTALQNRRRSIVEGEIEEGKIKEGKIEEGEIEGEIGGGIIEGEFVFLTSSPGGITGSATLFV